MDKIRLIKPCEQYLESYLEACREVREKNLNISSYHDPDKYGEWKDTIFQKYEESSKGVNLPEGYVPASFYWLVDEKNYIGSGSIRHYLNDSLKKFGGHIGYFIRPGYWNRGYGTLQLKLLLVKARELGIKKALLTCDKENAASARVMEKNGGKRIGEVKVEVEGVTRSIYKYEIAT